MRLFYWPFFQLEDHTDYKKKQKEGLERRLLQVHERQCQI
jgi:hypothetical protein